MKISSRWILPLGALISLLLTLILSFFPHLVESYYSQLIYPFIVRTQAFLFGWTYFPLAESLEIILVLLLFTFLLLCIFRKLSWRFLLQFSIQILSLSLITFILFWGLNFDRQALNTRLNIPKVKADQQLLMENLSYLIQSTNEVYIPISSINQPHIDSLVEAAYQKNADFLGIKHDYGSSLPRHMIFSRFYMSVGIAGIYKPFFGETYLNYYLPTTTYPFTLAHEKSHRYGVSSEAEANFYAWYTCFHSDSKVLRYSAQLSLLGYMIGQLKDSPEFKEYYKKLRPEVKADMARNRKHWLSFNKQTSRRIVNKIHDSALKLSGIKDGVADYYGVVRLFIDYRSKYNAIPNSSQ